MILSAQNLKIRYGNGALGILDVSLELNGGEVVVLFGPNGAGKTTTVRAITGFLRSERARIVSGSVELFGVNTTNSEPRVTTKAGVAFVPERHKVFASMSVKDNLDAVGRRAPRGRRTELTEKIFALFPILAERQRSQAGYLSGGQQQMLAIARDVRRPRDAASGIRGMNIGGEDPGALLGLFNYEDEAGSPVLAVDGLDVRYGGVLALGDVSLQVKFHETVAVVGPNRAGKSTLLNAISGLAKDRSRGSIMIQGRQILGKGALHVARAGVGRTFQDPPLIDTETVLQNVLLGQHLRMGYRTLDQLVRPWKVNRVERAAREQCVGLLEFFGLGDVKDTLAGQLPYGTRKLIDIVRAVCGPRLLLLDEPTSGLDLDEQTALSASLRALHSSTPISILIVEHHMDVVRAVADSVVGLEGGSVVTTGSASQVLDSEVFRAALIGTRPADASDVSVSLEAQKETSWHSS